MNYSGLLDGHGVLERPVAASDWLVPDVVAIERRHLAWEAELWPEGYERDSRTFKTPSRGMLEQFVALEHGSDEDIARYARRWGLLGVERFPELDSRVKCWRAPGNWDFPLRLDFQEKIDGRTITFGWERLAYWRFWIARFAAAIRTGARLSEDKSPLQSDWQLLLGVGDCSRWGSLAEQRSAARDRWLKKAGIDAFNWQDANKRWAALGEAEQREWKELLRETPEERLWKLWSACQPNLVSVQYARAAFYVIIAQWQKAGGVNLFLNPFDNRLEIRTGSLFSGLVWQLMAAVCNSDGLAICSDCGSTYRPKRKPNPDKRAYCPGCVRKGIPRRNATRAFRERQKQSGSGDVKEAR